MNTKIPVTFTISTAEEQFCIEQFCKMFRYGNTVVFREWKDGKYEVEATEVVTPSQVDEITEKPTGELWTCTKRSLVETEVSTNRIIELLKVVRPALKVSKLELDLWYSISIIHEN